jgi:hypothetical protein
MTMKTKQEANTGSDVPTCSAISDTDRLDWLQNKQKTAWRIEHEEWRDTTEFPFRRERVTVFEGWAVNEGDDPQKDIRAAIDAAIHSQNANILPPAATENAHE